MYLSDGKLNKKIIALCSVFVRIDHIYSDNKLYIVAMLCYICEKNIFLCLGVRIMDHVYSRGTSMKKG